MTTTGRGRLIPTRISTGLGRLKRAELLGLLRPSFVQVERCLQAGKCAAALTSQILKRNGWTIAEHAEDWTPDKTQRLLNRACWNSGAAMAAREFVVAGLGAGAIMHTEQGGKGDTVPAAFRAACQQVGIAQSIRGPDSAPDNAAIESWHSSLEFELRRVQHFTARAAARVKAAVCIEDYNTRCRHLRLLLCERREQAQYPRALAAPVVVTQTVIIMTGTSRPNSLAGV
jgi:transposase InsO family protein